MIANCKCGYSWNTSSKYPRCTRCRKVIRDCKPGTVLKYQAKIDELDGFPAEGYSPIHSPSRSKRAASLIEFHLWLKENMFDPCYGKKEKLVSYYRQYLDFKGLGHTHYQK
jgi:hypothetical protein